MNRRRICESTVWDNTGRDGVNWTQTDCGATRCQELQILNLQSHKKKCSDMRYLQWLQSQSSLRWPPQQCPIARSEIDLRCLIRSIGIDLEVSQLSWEFLRVGRMQDESNYTDKKSASNFECDGRCIITVRLQYVRVYLVAYVCYLLSILCI